MDEKPTYRPNRSLIFSLHVIESVASPAVANRRALLISIMQFPGKKADELPLQISDCSAGVTTA
jgi:hypothetical protein